MRVTFSSSLSCREYLTALKGNLGNHFGWDERFTGFYLGNLFTVTHHSGYEWNRRITNVKNTALGFVRKADTGCEIKFLRIKGYLAPTLFLPLFLFSELCCILAGDPFFPFTGLALTALVSLGEALAEYLTDESWTGEKSLLSLMLDPENPYDNLNKI